MNEEMNRRCFDGTLTLQLVYPGKYVKVPVLNPNLPADIKDKCEKMTWKENTYLTHLKNKQSLKSAGDIETLRDEEEEPDNTISWDVAKDLAYDPLPL